ncbi:hypothetical protein SAMN06265374_0921 [Roseibium denhamense]|uniref:Transposase n=1 Tax=Roseibium denhamense TaxID=76305 RepID=A0ABY1NFV2_9HYPH|nr:hypothetical protein SAMN06265374_0921 [Roseibium denhamense]
MPSTGKHRKKTSSNKKAAIWPPELDDKAPYNQGHPGQAQREPGSESHKTTVAVSIILNLRGPPIPDRSDAASGMTN